MMKTLIAATALTLVAGAAFAGEGHGDPFRFTAPPIAVSTQGAARAAAVTQNPFPYTTPGMAMNSSPVLPSSGSQGVVQTANSLPVGFEDGASAATNLNRNVPTPTQLAQPAATVVRSHG